MHGLEESSRALNKRPIPDLAPYSRERGQAQKYLTQFNESALADARGRPWYRRWPIVLAARRRWRKLRKAGS